MADSIDTVWMLHGGSLFEKMLYNQGSLAESYLEVGRMTGESDLLETGKNVLDAMLKQFQLEDGALPVPGMPTPVGWKDPITSGPLIR